MSNREFFLTYCVESDLCAIYRYAMWELSTEFQDKPLWERSEIFDQWLSKPFNSRKWEAAKSRSSKPF